MCESGRVQVAKMHPILTPFSFFATDFVRTKNFDALAGVILAVTGCEAML